MFRIGDIEIKGDVFLAPMAGVSDSPYRLICRRMGAGFSFTDFVSTDGVLKGLPKILKLLRFKPEERPIIYQIFGNNPDTIRRAALIARENDPDVIDLNMGCSCTRVAHKGSGAGLLKDLPRARRIIEGLVKHLDIPVTAKIRLGYNEHTLNYLDTAAMLEDAGVAMISVHGRTKTQAYKGRADWNAIGELASRARVPVLGNGDVTSFEEALEKKRRYGVDGVLIGRGAIGNPWLFGGGHRDHTPITEIIDTALFHLRLMLDFYEQGLILFRKHASRYFSGWSGAATLRAAMVRVENEAEAMDLCLYAREYFRRRPRKMLMESPQAGSEFYWPRRPGARIA